MTDEQNEAAATLNYKREGEDQIFTILALSDNLRKIWFEFKFNESLFKQKSKDGFQLIKWGYADGHHAP